MEKKDHVNMELRTAFWQFRDCSPDIYFIAKLILEFLSDREVVRLADYLKEEIEKEKNKSYEISS